MISKKNSGVALIQVLFVSVVLAVLVLSFSQKSIQAIDLAEQALTRSEILLKLQSAESQVLLVLLSNTNDSGVVTGKFNRYNQPFSVDTQVGKRAEQRSSTAPKDLSTEVQVELQDLAGLFQLAPYGSGRLGELLQQFGYNKNKATSISLAMEDWQDPDNQTRTGGAEQASYDAKPAVIAIHVRNAPFQTENELAYVQGMQGYMPEELERVLTFYPSGHFNPMTAPAEVLALYMSDKSRLAEIIKKRQLHQLTGSDLIQLTGIETNDTMMPIPGKGSRVKLVFNHGPHYISIQKEWVVSPYEQLPITLWSMKRN